MYVSVPVETAVIPHSLLYGDAAGGAFSMLAWHPAATTAGNCMRSNGINMCWLHWLGKLILPQLTLHLLQLPLRLLADLWIQLAHLGMPLKEQEQVSLSACSLY